MSKTVLFQAIQFSQTVLIKKIQFSISIVFVNTQLMSKQVMAIKRYSAFPKAPALLEPHYQIV